MPVKKKRLLVPKYLTLPVKDLLNFKYLILFIKCFNLPVKYLDLLVKCHNLISNLQIFQFICQIYNIKCWIFVFCLSKYLTLAFQVYNLTFRFTWLIFKYLEWTVKYPRLSVRYLQLAFECLDLTVWRLYWTVKYWRITTIFILPPIYYKK